MPIYEYRCSACNRITEKICRSEVSALTCPACGASAKRIVSVCSGKTENSNANIGGCRPASGFT